MGASFHLSKTAVKGNWSISNNRGTSLWNFAPSCLDLENFATAYQSSKLEKGGRSEHDKLDRHGSTKTITPPTLDRCSLLQRSSSSVYSTILSRGSMSDS